STGRLATAWRGIASIVSAQTTFGERQRTGRLATASEHRQCKDNSWRATASDSELVATCSLSEGL
ncbi:hypothetical protein L195_g060860, partial [Trifolium pratense]